MKYFNLVVIFCVLFVFILSRMQVEAKETNEEVEQKKGKTFSNKGVVYFAPINEDDHEDISQMTTINGAELFLTWKTVEPEEGNFDWSLIDKYVEMYKKEGKELSIRIAIGNGLPNDTPKWLYNNYGVRRLISGQWCNFENKIDDYQLGKISYIVNEKDTDDVICQGNSLLAHNKTHNDEIIISTKKNTKLNGKNYSLQFDYKVLEDCNFYAKYITQKGKEIFIKQWQAVKGEEGSKVVDFSSETPVEQIVIGMKDKGKIVLDNLNIADITDNGWFGSQAGLPDFFDPVFKQKYEQFVKEFSTKYDDEETITSVAIGGFGRWEEITLDPNDSNGFEDQLITYGYTDAKYIEHLKWCIDLYQKYFNNKQLTMCTYGHGDFRYTNEELVNWTIAGYAANKGITIKYNGWQEICSDWGENTHFAYQFNRYDNDIETAYEEGGQITNNYVNVMGHPLSAINRALIDNTDYLWIYGIDIKDPHINRYFHYANEQIGNVLNTRFYNRLGKYELNSNFDLKKYTYYNIWNGIFLSNDWNRLIPDNYTKRKVNYTEIDGEKCVGTMEDQYELYFSINDSQKYLGMYGSTISFEYYDKGNDTVKLRCYYQDENKWKDIGTIKKTNTGKWKRATFYIKDAWANTYIGHGKSNLKDFCISDNKDGVDYIRSVDLAFVPAREWRTERIGRQKTGNTINYQQENFKFKIDLSHSDVDKNAICGIEIPIGVKEIGKNNCIVSVYQKNNLGWEIVGKKEFYMCADKDKLFVPIIPNNLRKKFKVEIEILDGIIGIYNSDDGIVCNLYKYLGQSDKIPDNEVLDFEAPFYGFKFYGKSKNTAILKLYKVINDEKVEISQDKVMLDDDGEGCIFFEPQTPGKYKVDINHKDMEVKVLSLVRKQEVYKPKKNSIGEEVVCWNFKDDNGWKILYPNNKVYYDDNAVRINMSSDNLFLQKNDIEHKANMADNIEFTIKNKTTSSLTRIYWKTEGDEDYNASKSIYVPIVPNDNEFREYSFPIGLEKKWDNKIIGIKVEPVCGDINVGSVEMNSIKITKGKKPNHEYNEALSVTSHKIYHKNDYVETIKNVNEQEEEITIDKSFSLSKYSGILIMLLILIGSGLVYLLAIKKH